jgi:hypothetical protein
MKHKALAQSGAFEGMGEGRKKTARTGVTSGGLSNRITSAFTDQQASLGVREFRL